MTNDVDTLAAALYARTDDLLKQYPDLAPWRPKIGLQPQLSDAELVTLAVMQALLGYTSEARRIRHARTGLGHLFPYLPGQPGYNRRLRAAAGLITILIRLLAADTSLWTDDVQVVDSTPVECGRSKDTTRRSDLAGWAEYGYCASHSRHFWGLRLHLVATLGGLPVACALTGAKADERQTLLASWTPTPLWPPAGPGKSSSPTASTTAPASRLPSRCSTCGCCARPAKASVNGPARTCSSHYARPSSRSTRLSKASPALERHGGHTPAGVIVRVLQRILALTAAIWHNDHTGAPVHRSLTAYDH